MAGQNDNKLTGFRDQIDKLTFELMELFCKRGDVALIIAREKQRMGMAQIRDMQRETEVIARALHRNKGPFPDESITRFIQLLMDESSTLQSTASGIPNTKKASKKQVD